MKKYMIKCLECNTPFETYGYIGRNIKYCSRECYKKNTTGNKNGNWKGGNTKKCPVCGNEFSKYTKSCSLKCGNALRGINASKTNLGKTKYNTSHLMKMSIERKNKKRSKQICENISIGTKREMHKPEKWKKYLLGLKNKDYSFTKTAEWNAKRIKNSGTLRYKYKNIKMRSSWEVLFAEWLDKNGYTWQYEPLTVRLKNIDKCYCPDFFVKELDSFIEIKGYMFEESKIKIDEFKKVFGKNRLTVIQKREMQELGLL